MGWCAGTEMFDSMVDIALRYAPVRNTDKGAQVPEIIREAIIKDAYDAMSQTDWDCQSESKYWESDLVHLMYELDEIDDEDYKYYTDPDYEYEE
jgi:hypothetical protein